MLTTYPLSIAIRCARILCRDEEEQQERDALASIFSDEEPVEIPETRFPVSYRLKVNLKDLLAELKST